MKKIILYMNKKFNYQSLLAKFNKLKNKFNKKKYLQILKIILKIFNQL